MKKITNLDHLLKLRDEFSLIKHKAEQRKINRKEAKRALKIKRILNEPENKELLDLYEKNSDFRILMKGD